MNDDEIFAKTTAGKDELARRNQGLSARERRVLILIDGRKPLAELHRLLDDPDLDAVLDRLCQLGLAQPLQPPVAKPESPAQQRARALDFEAAREQLVELICQDLGDGDNAIIVRLNQCRSVDEVLAQMERVRGQLLNYVGRDRADYLCRRARALLDR